MVTFLSSFFSSFLSSLLRYCVEVISPLHPLRTNRLVQIGLYRASVHNKRTWKCNNTKRVVLIICINTLYSTRHTDLHVTHHTHSPLFLLPSSLFSLPSSFFLPPSPSFLISPSSFLLALIEYLKVECEQEEKDAVKETKHQRHHLASLQSSRTKLIAEADVCRTKVNWFIYIYLSFFGVC